MRTAAIMTIATLITGLAGTAIAVNIETVPVGNPGNAPDTEIMKDGTSGYGSVVYSYNIGKYEVTAGQYTEFLNAVAATDMYGLYDTRMWSDSSGLVCKIERIGSPGSYTYSVAADWANRPVIWVDWGDAARFANWLHNGQPTGEQKASTTEDGAYYLNGGTDLTALSAVTRKTNAIWAIPTENEWYKAAYHRNDGITGNYYDYPTNTNSYPDNRLIDPDPGNNATIRSTNVTHHYTIGSPYWRTEAGAHENSNSPYGTFDQAGNVWEWNEAKIGSNSRGVRGGTFFDDDWYGVCSHAKYRNYNSPTYEWGTYGFRVVQPFGSDPDGDGVPDTLDQCPNTAPGEQVDENGCSCSQKSCDDSDACTTDTCNQATAECSNTTVTCDDGDPCTTDTCDPATGCMYTPDLTDSDGDSVLDCIDECPDSAPGSWVNLLTGCPTCWADRDRDGDVDQEDFAAFQRCSSGPGIPADPNCE